MKLLWPAQITHSALQQSLDEARLFDVANHFASKKFAPSSGIPLIIDNSNSIVREASYFLQEKLFYSPAYQTDKTVKTYAECLAAWFDYAEKSGFDWRRATPRVILRYRNSIKNTISEKTNRLLAVRTINLRLVVVSEVYEFYWSRLSLQPSPSAQIYHDSLQELSRLKLNLRGGIKKQRSIPVAACNALVANLHGVHKLIFVWSVSTGLRIGALLNVKLVDFEQLCSEVSDRFVFVLSKGGKVVHAYVPRLVIERTSRYVEIDRVLSLGREIKSGRPPEALFLNSTGTPVSYSCYYSAFKRACSTIRIKANPHQARNTFATVVERRMSTSPAFNDLDSVKVMQGLLSHASSETTEDYLDSIVSNNSDVLALLEDVAGDIAGGV
jgi:integrase